MKTLMWLSVLLLISSCAEQSALTNTPRTAPTSHIPQVTAQPLPTAAFLSTPTQEPTPLPSPIPTESATTVNPSGPMLVYLKDGDDALYAVTPETGWREVIPFDSSWSIHWLHSSLSPHTGWIAVTSGGLNNGATDLTLQLIHVPDGAIRTVGLLVAPNYPSGIMEMARGWPTVLPGLFPSGHNWPELARYSAEYGLWNYRWSPDGRYLAYASQVGGASVDAYIYDIDANLSKRLTDDPQNAVAFNWTPDGRWLMLSNSVPGEIYDSATLHRLDPQGDVITQPAIWERGTWWSNGGWLSNRELLLTNYYDGSKGDLRKTDMGTEQQLDLWPTEYESYAIDEQGRELYVSALNDEAGNYTEGRGGLFAISLDDGRIHKISPSVYWQIVVCRQPDVRIFANTGKGIVSVSRDGSESGFSNIDGTINISPTCQWAAIMGEKVTEIHNLLTGEITSLETSITSVLWAPDDIGVVLVASRQLQYFSFLSQRLSVLEACEGEQCGFEQSDLGWAQ